MPLCTARFAAERHAVVRGSNPRGRIFFGNQPFRALTSCGGSGWDDSAGGGRRCLAIQRSVAPPPGLAMQGAGQTAPRRPARHRLGRDARALAESRSCLRGRSGRCYPVPRGTKCMHHRSAPLRWRGVAVPLVAARQRRDDHTRVGCTPCLLYTSPSPRDRG